MIVVWGPEARGDGARRCSRWDHGGEGVGIVEEKVRGTKVVVMDWSRSVDSDLLLQSVQYLLTLLWWN